MSNSSSDNLVEVQEILVLINSLIPIPFCFLAFIALVYYVKRRLKLHRILNRLSIQQVREPTYQSDVKNLQIKSMIYNFVIIILIIEILNNSCYTTYLLPIWFGFLGVEQSNYIENFDYLITITQPAWYLEQITGIILVPMLCLVLKVLWLAYHNFPYQYAIMRWAWYCIIRILIWLSSFCVQYIRPDYVPVKNIIGYIFFAILFVSDYVIYLAYSHRFYLHLKSRQKEAFYFYDQEKYREERNICLHFKYTTIIVAIGLFLYNFGLVFQDLKLVILQFFYFNNVELGYDDIYDTFMSIYVVLPSQMLYRLSFNFSYLYLMTCFVYDIYRKRRNIATINQKIRPMLKYYHDSIWHK